MKPCYNQPVPRFTVDELARLGGTTGRNVRAFQTQGLLPRPELVGRTGFYGDEHLERLRAVVCSVTGSRWPRSPSCSWRWTPVGASSR